jgi:hypothetical protein
MSKGAWRVRPSVVRGIIGALKATGVQIGRIELTPDDRVIITPKDATSAASIEVESTDGRPNSFDEVLGRG